MSRRRSAATGAMLDLWRPPADAGDALGCLASTFTFDSTLFEEQCLGRFLGVETLTERDGLVSMLERENALGGIFAGVLVDHQRAGVNHSMRWDVLPVRITGGIQHAKLSVLAWQRHVRVIVASANLTEPGYRSNQEIATTVALTPSEVDRVLWQDVSHFLRELLEFTPSCAARSRAEAFLARVETLIADWAPIASRRDLHQRLVCTLPARGTEVAARSTLSESLALCQRLGGYSPTRVAVASPFFDQSDHERTAMQALGRAMGRGTRRRVELAVPMEHITDATQARVKAPRFLLTLAQEYADEVTVTALPAVDEEKNPREWHAKMLRLADDGYVALIVGSSNFTTAGLGTDSRFNAEANLLTVIRDGDRRGDAGALEAIWPPTTTVAEPGAAEWIGSGDEEGTAGPELDRIPMGFVSATFHAGPPDRIELVLAESALPAQWSVWATGEPVRQLVSSDDAIGPEGPGCRHIAWVGASPPDTLMVRWDDDRKGILPVNVEDPSRLAAPADLDALDSEAMLRLLAATNPAAELRLLLRERIAGDESEDLLDTALSPELDPLRRFDLRETFLYRVRARARLMEGVRANLERPVWSATAFEWRLRGMIGPQEVARRLVREAETAADPTDALFAAADLVIVLREVTFRDEQGGLPVSHVRRTFSAFRKELARDLDAALRPLRPRIAANVLAFWDGIVEEAK
ncbi:MAG: hypothetical protein IPJ78_10295 [Gemmatimonadetes bacterium]|nr:hypothetical protein [Gemmatimonadota bacterium]